MRSLRHNEDSTASGTLRGPRMMLLTSLTSLKFNKKAAEFFDPALVLRVENISGKIDQDLVVIARKEPGDPDIVFVAGVIAGKKTS